VRRLCQFAKKGIFAKTTACSIVNLELTLNVGVFPVRARVIAVIFDRIKYWSGLSRACAGYRRVVYLLFLANRSFPCVHGLSWLRERFPQNRQVFPVRARVIARLAVCKLLVWSLSRACAGYRIPTFTRYCFAYNAKYIRNLVIFAILFSRTYCTTLQNLYCAYVAYYTSEIITFAFFLFHDIVKFCFICKT
jgi:hypothetical protein